VTSCDECDIGLFSITHSRPVTREGKNDAR
jgi:hypothetical protein